MIPIIIIPIISFLLCIVLVIVSVKKHKWAWESIVSIIVSLMIGCVSLVQGIGSYRAAERSGLELKSDHEMLIAKQDQTLQLLSEMSDKIDSNLSQTTDLGGASDGMIFKEDIFFVDIKVRHEGELDWKRGIEAQVGDVIEFQVEYRNRKRETSDDVMVRSVLPTNMEYINDSTVLYNSHYQEGISLKDNSIATSGINIGAYDYQGNAYVTFKTMVIDVDLEAGMNQLITWAAITDNGNALYYDASVFVEK